MSNLAPNLESLSLSRMKNITTPIFADLAKKLTKLQELDITDCKLVYSVGVKLVAE